MKLNIIKTFAKLFFALSLFTSAGAQAQNKEKIQSINYVTREAKTNFGNYIPGDTIWQTIYDREPSNNYNLIFDENGNTIDEVQLYKDINPETRHIYRIWNVEFNNTYSDGKLLKQIQSTLLIDYTSYVKNNKSTQFSFYKYGEDSSLETDIYQDNLTNLQSKTFYKRVDSLHLHDFGGGYLIELNEIEKYTTNKKTFISDTYSGKGDLLNETRIIKNSSGDYIHTENYDNNLNYSGSASYKYAIFAFPHYIKEIQERFWNGTMENDVMQFDSVGHLIFKVEGQNALNFISTELNHSNPNSNQEFNQSISGGTKLYYNKNGDVIEVDNSSKAEIGQVPDNSTSFPKYNFKYAYKYDQYGNWVEKEAIYGDKNIPLYYVQRIIKYFSDTKR